MATQQEGYTQQPAMTAAPAAGKKDPVKELSEFFSGLSKASITPETQGPKPWHNEFWSFVSPTETCVMAYFCPCVVFGRTHHRLRDPTMTNYEHINGACIAWVISSYVGLHWVLTGLTRGEMRSKYSLEGNPATDFGCAYLCPWCTLVQQEKESEYLATAGGAGGDVAMNDGYQKTEGGMTYPPA